MNIHSTHPNPRATCASQRSRKSSSCLRFAGMRTRRPVRIALPLPRREACLTRRAMRAALREAEFYDWLHQNNDFTAAMHQPVH
jgi:hypothetical protein